ncbi:MAG: Ig-like domain-containing protein [Prevotella sp.]|nr:Ig-like domain-containing protein [Prevotella sp.]
MKKFLYISCLALAIAGCARMGQPDGGWYDDDPPKVIGCIPEDQATNVSAKKITIMFDEYIKLTDATNKVIVSPPQLEVPDIKAAGKKIVVALQDSLMENTTYTIDFSDAISDNNENNPMGSYTYSFSTGEKIDTFEVSGYVLDASNLEPIKGIMVGLYNDLADSAFKTKPMLRVSRTDSRGHFVVKGVAPGTYRAYALQDADGDFRFSQKSEMIGFSNQTFEPGSKPDVRTDTVWRDSLHIDALIKVPYTHFLPDDITLLAFTHVQTDRFLIKTERVEANKFSMYFSYGHPDLPIIRGLDFESDSAFVIEANEKRDTIHYWIRDTALVNRDTLNMEISYQKSDSTGLLVNQTDTIEALAKVSYEKRQKELNKEIEQWKKNLEKMRKRGEEVADTVWHEKPLEPKYDVPSSMDPDKILRVEMPTPLQHCDTAAVHLYSMIDSVWYESECHMKPVPNMIRQYEIQADWRPGIEYSLEIDSAAFIDIYGKVANAFKQGIKVKAEDEYGTLKLNIAGVEDSAMVVQLLNGSDKMVKQTRVAKHVAEFKFIKPDKYYISAFIDRNGNGVWDTGDYDENLQAEAVYYYPREIECKAKWDITQSWDISSTPVYKQKPEKITKQKPEAAKKLKSRNAERARKLGIEYLKEKGINIDSKK